MTRWRRPANKPDWIERVPFELEDIQDFVVARLAGYEPFNGAVVIADDGTYPKTPGLENALATVGLALVVWAVECAGSVEVVRDGAVVYNTAIYVIVHENQIVCRSATGANVRWEKAVRLVMQRLAGSGPGGCGADNAIQPQDQPWENMGKTQGINRASVNFIKQLITEPDLS